MLWHGHRGFAAVILKIAKNINIEINDFTAAMKDTIRYSVYPDAIFNKRLFMKYFPDVKEVNCRWRVCAYKMPCTASPDLHHVRWCARTMSFKAWKEFARTKDFRHFGIMTHFVADLICEQYEGILTIGDQWDYRAKAVPLSDLAEKLSLNFDMDNEIIKSAVLKFLRLDKIKPPALLHDVKNMWLGLVLNEDDVIGIVGYAARAKVQKRRFEEALSDSLALSVWLLKKGIEKNL